MEIVQCEHQRAADLTTLINQSSKEAHVLVIEALDEPGKMGINLYVGYHFVPAIHMRDQKILRLHVGSADVFLCGEITSRDQTGLIPLCHIKDCAKCRRFVPIVEESHPKE